MHAPSSGKPKRLLDEPFGFLVKHLFAAFGTEVVGLAFVRTLPLSGLLVYFHTADRVFGHTLPPSCRNCHTNLSQAWDPSRGLVAYSDISDVCALCCGHDKILLGLAYTCIFTSVQGRHGKLRTKLANPAPLGLMGFGMTTVLLNLHNTGFYGLDSMILAMGIVYGGVAQVLAGIMEFQRGNTFGTTAFTSYGLFWLSLVALKLLPSTGLWIGPTANAMAAYFFMWGLFTFVMFFGTLKTSRALQFVFMSLAVLFFLLTTKELTGNTSVGILAGYEGIICGLSAVYLALAEVINEAQGKERLPIGMVPE